MHLLASLLLALLASPLAAQVTTAPITGLHTPTKRVVAYTNCTVVSEPGNIITNGVVIVRNNRILSVGSGLAIPVGADVRDLKGAWVYPGFVDPFMDVADLSQSRRSDAQGSKTNVDEEDENPTTPHPIGAHHWNQAVRPERTVLDALSLPDKAVESAYKLGYCTASIGDHDGIFSGSAAVATLVAGPVAEHVLRERAAQMLDFRKGSSRTPYPSSLMGSIALLRQTFKDAVWYGASANARFTPTAQNPEVNLSLDALYQALSSKQRFIATAYDEHDVARWQRIAAEAGITLVIKGSGLEYRRLPYMAATKPDLILPLSLPDVPDVRDPATAADVRLVDLIHWYWAADNPRLLDSVGCRIAFTPHGLKDPSVALKNLRLFVRRGLDSAKALAAITTIPATYVGVADQVGTIAPNKLANLVITSGPLFNDNSVIQFVVVAGNQHNLKPPAIVDVRGTWTLTSSALQQPVTLDISGTPESPSLQAKTDTIKVDAMLTLEGQRLVFSLTMDSAGIGGTVRGSCSVDSILMKGALVLPDGSMPAFVLRRDKPYTQSSPAKGKPDSTLRMALPTTLPLGPFGYDSIPEQESIVLTHATVWTCGPQGVLEDADVAISGGKIVGIGKGLSGGRIVDCTGKHITPGIIDEHSHIAISRGVNEGTHAVTTEVRIGDVVDPDDVDIYRQLAGGVTASHLLHGSANPMGGQLQLIRMRWGADAEGLKQNNAKPTVKFALGENVKQSNWGDRYSVRYPQTRMGVEEVMRDAFARARAYRDERSKASIGGTPVRQDLQLDALVEILDGSRNIHCHSYKQSEILMLMRLAEEFGFKVATFTHILEGYKVAREMKQHGAHASSFSDWWAYKFEVYDAIPQNPAIMHEQDVVVSINSDDAEMARRLNQEAGKSVSYGGVSEQDALKFVTLNPAIQMEMDASMGSLEVGKDADVVVWSGNPLSNLSRCERTFVEGREMFSLELDAQLRQRDHRLRRFLEQEALRALDGGDKPASRGSAHRRYYHCDTIEDEMCSTAAH